MTVWAEPAHVDLGIALANRAEGTTAWLGLGRGEIGPFRLVLTRDRAAFARIARGRVPSWGAGMTLPAARMIVIRLDAGDPVGTLRHELAHLALHAKIRGRVPLWFSEGYAVVAAGEWGRFHSLRLNFAVARGRVPELRALDRDLRDAEGTAEAAYALAGSAVLDLAKRNPTGSLEPLFARLTAGEPFAGAVLATTGLSLDRFGEAWRKGVKRQYGILVWLGAGGIWVLVALAVLFLRGWRREADRPRREALDLGWVVQEETEESGESPKPLDPEEPPK